MRMEKISLIVTSAIAVLSLAFNFYQFNTEQKSGEIDREIEQKKGSIETIGVKDQILADIDHILLVKVKEHNRGIEENLEVTKRDSRNFQLVDNDLLKDFKSNVIGDETSRSSLRNALLNKEKNLRELAPNDSTPSRIGNLDRSFDPTLRMQLLYAAKDMLDSIDYSTANQAEKEQSYQRLFRFVERILPKDSATVAYFSRDSWVRSLPQSDSASRAFTAVKDQACFIEKRNASNAWYYVRVANDRRGWVYSDNLLVPKSNFIRMNFAADY